jgi:hypothetical protein
MTPAAGVGGGVSRRFDIDGPVDPGDEQRSAMARALVKNAKDSISGDALVMIRDVVPRIPGGVTGAELAAATSRMLSGDKLAAIEDAAPYIREGMTQDDFEELTEDLLSSDRAAALRALADAGSRLPWRTKPKPPPVPPDANDVGTSPSEK